MDYLGQGCEDSSAMKSPPWPADGFALETCGVLGSITYDDLPTEVVKCVKTFLLDSLGVLGAAANAPGIDVLLRRLTAWETSGSATILLGKQRVSPPTAALANASAIHALDFDDQHDAARVHSYSCVVPAVLAAAEDRGATSGRDALTALAVGVELHARLGLACRGSFDNGWMPTVAFGTLASAIAAGQILGLDSKGLNNALGIAFHQASGNGQAREDHTLTKRLGPGFAARSGVLSAYLASDGITGPHRSLEGKSGIFHLFEHGEGEPRQISDGLGVDWRLLEFSLKPYPSCRCNHTLIALGLELYAEGLRAGEVEQADLFLGRQNFETVRGPFRPEGDIQVHAQFNAAYNFARALMDGRVDLQTFLGRAILDSEVAALARRVTTHMDPGIPALAIEPARVCLRLTNGRVIDRRKETMIGGPNEPMTVDEAMKKFESCLKYGLGASKSASDRLAEHVLNLEQHSTSDLMEAFLTCVKF